MSSTNTKKKILMIIPTLEVGGTTSSLETFYRLLKNNYDITIAAIYHLGDKDKSFNDKLLPEDTLTSLYYASFRHSSNIRKWIVLIFKVIKTLCAYLGLKNIEQYILKRFIKKVEKTDSYDAVIAFQEGNSTKAVAYSSIPKRIAWVHCDYRRVPNCGNELNIYSKYDTIVCVSKYTAEIFKEIYPGIKQKVTSIHNPLDIELIKSKSQKQIDDKNFDNSKFTIVSVGRISTVKRFEEIPKIADFLKKEGCKFTWYILGPVIEEDNYILLKNEIKKYNVSDCVICLGNKNNPYPYMCSSNLLVSLSKSEACPMIFNEAKILALPMVSTDFGSSFEFIDIEKNGLIASLDKIGEQIFKLYKNNDLYNHMKYNLMNTEISNEQIYNSFVNII